jgi:hypothetical protein
VASRPMAVFPDASPESGRAAFGRIMPLSVSPEGSHLRPLASAGCVKTPCRNGNQQFRCAVQVCCEPSLPTPTALRRDRARRTRAIVFSHSLEPGADIHVPRLLQPLSALSSHWARRIEMGLWDSQSV